jgi:uncharacterized protein YciI
MFRLAPVLLLGLAACAGSATHDLREYTWIWILTGPRDEQVLGEERSAAFAGHFANMERLALEGRLLIAGPMLEPRASDDQRGIFVLNTPDPSEGIEIASADPAVQAGIFKLMSESFLTSAPIAEIFPRHSAYVAAYGAREANPGFHARPYVMLLGRPARAAEEALSGLPQVVLAGRLPERDSAVFWLDFAELAQAQEIVAGRAAAAAVACTWIPWFGSEEIGGLRLGQR